MISKNKNSTDQIQRSITIFYKEHEHERNKINKYVTRTARYSFRRSTCVRLLFSADLRSHLLLDDEIDKKIDR